LIKYNYVTIALGMTLLTTVGFAPTEVFSDSLTGGALTQRIGNLDVELKTVPATPIAGEKTIIFLRIGSINGDDVEDRPINIKITKQGEEILKSETIIVPDGHYTYSYEFATPDIYGIIIEIKSHVPVVEKKSSALSWEAGSQGLQFTFPINVRSKSAFGFSDIGLSLAIGVSIAVCAIIFLFRRRTGITRRTSY
jgi:hypothetical protein